MAHPLVKRSQLLLAVGLMVLDLMDGLLTLRWLEWGMATEANPIMRWLYVVSPSAFVLVKLCLIPVLCFMVGASKPRAWVSAALLGTFVVYFVVLIHHGLGLQ